MSEGWFNFAALMFVQFLVFLGHAAYEKKLADVPRILVLGALSGIVPGITCDLLFGKYLGLVSFAFEINPLSLILDAVIGYGLFAANVLLMSRARLLHFCTWMLIVTASFEITNLYFHVWTYAFPVLSVEFVLFGLVGAVVLAISIALSWHVLFKYRFVFLESISNAQIGWVMLK
ncbi:MAG: hypothetical protein WA021_00035 [Minisyncoccia bacterium]